MKAETAKETKERPILFSGPMVRAILDGRKTQTRRVVNLRGEDLCSRDRSLVCTRSRQIDCPYGKPGDRLWVRETWRVFGGREYEYQQSKAAVQYRADEIEFEQKDWRPSIFMFRWASRITLEITNIRVERLQDISEADAMVEGFTRETCASIFRKAAGRAKWSTNAYWVENDETGEEDGGDNSYMCRRCSKAIQKKHGKGWVIRASNCPETDGPAYCSCGTPLLMSLTQYGIERELLIEDDPDGKEPQYFPTTGMDASIAEMIADGFGDLQDEHFGRLAQIGFATAWNLHNGKKHPWESNPWVWVMEFKQLS